MPKIHDTRAQKARELLRLINRGPALSVIPGETLTAAEAERQTRIWLETWIEPLITALIPEIRK